MNFFLNKCECTPLCFISLTTVVEYKYDTFVSLFITLSPATMFASPAAYTECSKSEIDLFSIPPTQTSIENNYYTRVNPQSAITNSTTPIEFNIAASAEHFIDLANTFLYVRFSIKNATGAALEAGYKCYPETNILHTMFSGVEAYLNETKISAAASTDYAYRAFIENVLSCSGEEKTSRLICEGFFHRTIS